MLSLGGIIVIKGRKNKILNRWVWVCLVVG
jgi:hypothetical protein